MTGTIVRVGPQKRYCFIQAEGREFYAKRSEFQDRAIIRVGQRVQFDPLLPPPVTNVEAIQAA